jgi:ribosome-associated toxin RatA of RatAB toxin-antitoxin module
MIRKYIRVDARPETLRDLFREVEQWPSWMPSIESVEVLERSDNRAVALVRQRLAGRVSTQKLELLFEAQGHTETQLSGRLKHWKAVWRFVEPPTGKGTVVSTHVEIGLGASRFFVPMSVVQRMIDNLHALIVSRAEARARRREAKRMSTVWGILPGQKLSVRIYETPTELEVWLGDRRFVLPAAE